MPDFVYGTLIHYDDFRKNYEMISDSEPDSISEDEVNKAMALAAMKAKGEQVNEAIKQLNGMKDDKGKGVSTRVMLYNGLGIPLKFRGKHDDHGRWSENTLADRIEVGQWSIGFHHKTPRAASGSCAVLTFDLLGYGNDDVLLVGFKTPWGSSKCTALGQVILASTDRKMSWDEKMDWVQKSNDGGTKTFGRESIL